MGFSTWIEVNFFAQSYSGKYSRNTVTDMDVLGVAFDGDLTRRAIGAECKSPDAKGAEDILKLLGALRLFHAARGYLVKKEIAENARDVAASEGVVCLNEDEAMTFLKSVEPDGDNRVDREREHYDAWHEAVARLKTREAEAKTIRYLSHDYWTRQPWENIHNLLFLAQRGLVPSLEGNQPEQKALVVETARYFSVAILSFCNAVLATRLSAMERQVEIQLFGGPRARRERERLFDEIAKSAGAALFNGDPLKPAYLAKLKETIAYCLMSPLEACKMSLCLERVLAEDYLRVRDLYPVRFEEEFSNVTLKLAKDVTELLIGGTGGRSTLEELFQK
jgi:hypothetical protein